jgi:hypothetical protein
MTNSYY